MRDGQGTGITKTGGVGFLRLLPPPRTTHGVTVIEAQDVLARRAQAGDLRADVDRLTLVSARQEDIIATLQRQLDEASEARDTARALLATVRARALALEAQAARRGRAGRLVAVWAWLAGGATRSPGTPPRTGAGTQQAGRTAAAATSVAQRAAWRG